MPGRDRHPPHRDLERLELADRLLPERAGRLAQQVGELLKRFRLSFVLGEVHIDKLSQGWRVAARLLMADAGKRALQRLGCRLP